MISFKEDHISQIPALLLLQKLGYTYLSPQEALNLRGGSMANVLLEPILRKQLERINTIQVSTTKTTLFTSQNIDNGIDALRNVPMNEGFMAASQTVYDLLTYGKSLEQSVDGDKKSFNLQYIDWKNIANNVFHVTPEFAVKRAGMVETYRPDIVLFVNGIPLCVIECKRPDIKDSLEQAISQHLRNQQAAGIRSLYVYSELLLGLATQSASYATTATPAKFWSMWREQFTSREEEIVYKDELDKLVNAGHPDRGAVFEEDFCYAKSYFDAQAKQHIEPSEQDAYLYSLCRPERLLELMFGYTLYDSGVKKIARYQQYFAVKATMKRLLNIEGGRRRGGVIWHTQGSGKSLTMVMIAQAIVLERSIQHPKLILVTDRTDLDRQITDTFKKCGKFAENAKTGTQLAELLNSKSDAIITTVINKFDTAVKKIKRPLTDPNIFVLVDEGHRSQYGEMAVKMEKTLPNACCIAMTGTPLMKKEKNTAQHFGGIIQPVYTVDQAVKDKAVVPLLYEGRIVPQTVHENAIDQYFDMVCAPLSNYQRVDLKKKFSRAGELNQAEQRIYAIAWDISLHFRDNWQGTGFKGQLVASRKRIAILYKKFLDEIGIVSSEVLITSPDDREGEEEAYGETSNEEKAFWKKMMDKYGTPKKYETTLISNFKNSDKPEIIIVVDKLLTGFDEPKNAVMYLDRGLKEHALLQAIARVNRVCDDKDYGYIVDYYGVLGFLGKALVLYSDFDPDELEGTVIDMNEEIRKLPQKHSDLWAIFKGVANKRDLEAYGMLLRDKNLRDEFYEKLSDYARCLKMALSSIEFQRNTPDNEIEQYKKDLAMFLKLRNAVQKRYSDTVDYKQYEGQIKKLIDTHIESGEVKPITELVNIFDKERFNQEIEKVEGMAAKADTIASRTAKHISEKMDLDPAFYKKFSDLLKETITIYEQGRIDEAEYLKRVVENMNAVLSHTDSDIPAALTDNNAGRAYFGLALEVYKTVRIDKSLDVRSLALETAQAIDRIIQMYVIENGKIVVDWQSKGNIIGPMKIEMEDFLIDQIKRKYDVPLTFDDMDSIIDRCVDVAKLWLK